MRTLRIICIATNRLPRLCTSELQFFCTVNSAFVTMSGDIRDAED